MNKLTSEPAVKFRPVMIKSPPTIITAGTLTITGVPGFGVGVAVGVCVGTGVGGRVGTGVGVGVGLGVEVGEGEAATRPVTSPEAPLAPRPVTVTCSGPL